MAVPFKCVLFVLVIQLMSGYSHHIYEIDFNVNSDSDNSFSPNKLRIRKSAPTDEQNVVAITTGGTNEKETDKDIKTSDTSDKNDSEIPKINTVNTVDNTSTNDSAGLTVKNLTKINLVTDNVSPPQVDLSNPGVLKRGVIVFGGFALLAVAYFLFFRGKSVKNENLNIHNATDGPQFRYGVLQSDDKKDNLSRMPLTMESDEDEEDDLEVFDIEQKKKSLSYVNLQSHMEDIDNFTTPTDNLLSDNERNALLLDIDDRIPDNLINLTNSNHKSIL